MISLFNLVSSNAPAVQKLAQDPQISRWLAETTKPDSEKARLVPAEEAYFPNTSLAADIDQQFPRQQGQPIVGLNNQPLKQAATLAALVQYPLCQNAFIDWTVQNTAHYLATQEHAMPQAA